MKSRPARQSPDGSSRMAGGEKIKEQLKEELKELREELAIQKWGIRKTVKGKDYLIKELREELAIQKWGIGKTLTGMKDLVKEIIQKKKELAEANEILGQTDKAKTEFVSLASHQLRTPLSTISWYAEMLLAGDAGKLNDEQTKYLGEVHKGNQRMVALVNALLNVSRLDLGTFTVEPKPTDIVKLAQSVIDEQKPQIETKKIKLSEKYANNLPKLNADPKLLRMVFQNLLSNSVKYTPEKGKVGIEISLTNFSQPPSPGFRPPSPIGRGEGEGILITVSDTGYGIPKNQQDKIFSKLFRADNVRKKDTEGTGLGLYIVKSIIDHSGGMIWFESEENKGTIFYVTLPIVGMKKKKGTKALT